MINEDLNSELYDRMLDEQYEWRKLLLSLTPDQVLDHAYEYTSREDILMELEGAEISSEQCRTLLKSSCPLADIYTEFERMETDHMDNIRQSIENRAKHVVEMEKEER